MMNLDEYKKIALTYGTPVYVFDTEALRKRTGQIREIAGPAIKICYAMKANPFLAKIMSEEADALEVCSPGELDICSAEKVPGGKIVYSGVNKTREDILDALKMQAEVYTAESVHQTQLLQDAARELQEKGEAYAAQIPVLLRLNGGSQFGMSREDIHKILADAAAYPNLSFVGIHYFVGTQRKKLSRQQKELEMLQEFMEQLRRTYGLALRRLEYGPGLPVPYFEGDDFADTLQPLRELSPFLQKAAGWCDLTIEMGRFFAAECGIYITRVMDSKENAGTHYAILDGGMNHVTYYGQVMGMKVPVIDHIPEHGAQQEKSDANGAVCSDACRTEDADAPQNNEMQNYALCGSLCTTADVLVREAPFTDLRIGDLLVFHNIGAYSVTEGIYLFLSRKMPRVLLYNGSRNGEMDLALARDFVNTAPLNHSSDNI